MCKLCDAGQPREHRDEGPRWNARRGFLKASGAAGVLALFNPGPAAAC